MPLSQKMIDWLKEHNQHRTFGSKIRKEAIICPETKTYLPIDLFNMEKIKFCPLCGKELGDYGEPMEDGSFRWEH